MESLMTERRAAVDAFDIVSRGEKERSVARERKVRETVIGALEHWQGIVAEDMGTAKTVKKNIIAHWVRSVNARKQERASAAGSGGGGDDLERPRARSNVSNVSNVSRDAGGGGGGVRGGEDLNQRSRANSNVRGGGGGGGGGDDDTSRPRGRSNVSGVGGGGGDDERPRAKSNV